MTHGVEFRHDTLLSHTDCSLWEFSHRAMSRWHEFQGHEFICVCSVAAYTKAALGKVPWSKYKDRIWVGIFLLYLK